MEPLKFEFTPTEWDYAGAIAGYFLGRRWTTWFVIPAGLSTALYAIFMSLFLWWQKGVPTFGLCVSGPVLLVILLATYALQPLLLVYKVKKNERLRGINQYEVDEEKISVHTPYAQASYDWGTYGKLTDTGKYYLLIYSTNSRMFNLIPKRAFSTLQQETEFLDLAKKKLQKFSNTNQGVPNWLIMLFATAAGGCLWLLFTIITFSMAILR